MEFKNLCSLQQFYDFFVSPIPIYTVENPSIITFPKIYEGCIAKLSVLFARSDEIHEYIQLALDINESGIYTTDEHDYIVFTVTELELPLDFLSIMMKDKPSCLSNFDKNSARLQVKINHSDGSIDCVKSEILRNTNLDVSNEISVSSCESCFANPQMGVISLERPVPYFTDEMYITLICRNAILANKSNDFPVDKLIFDLPSNWVYKDNYLEIIVEVNCVKFGKKWTNPNPNTQKINVIRRSIENRKKKISTKDDEDIISDNYSYAVPEVNNQLPKDIKGICLVINNDEFKKGKPRMGSKYDVEHITKVFTKLSYHYLEFHNMSTRVLQNSLKDLQSQIKESRLKIVVWLLSHGNENVFRTFDGVMSYLELASYFSNKEWPNLVNSIKFYFYSCCQGNKINTMGVEERYDSEMKTPSIYRNCFRVFAAPPGYKSFRCTCHGSILTCISLDEIERDPFREINDIYNEIHSIMASLHPTSKNHHHIPRSHSTLTKKAYLILTETEEIETESIPASNDTFIGNCLELSSDTEIVRNNVKCKWE